MATNLISKAFEEGVKAALKLFQGPVDPKTLARSAEKVMKSLQRAVHAATRVAKK